MRCSRRRRVGRCYVHLARLIVLLAATGLTTGRSCRLARRRTDWVFRPTLSGDGCIAARFPAKDRRVWHIALPLDRAGDDVTGPPGDRPGGDRAESGPDRTAIGDATGAIAALIDAQHGESPISARRSTPNAKRGDAPTRSSSSCRGRWSRCRLHRMPLWL